MKAINLNTAAIDNSGKRHEAGSTLVVGDGKAEIAALRATALVARALATEVVSAAKAAAATSAD